MQTADALQYLLGIQDPWEVGEVDVTADNSRLDVHVRLANGADGDPHCPQCGMPLNPDMDAEIKVWRHMNVGAMQTYLHLQVPPCAELGCTVMESWGNRDAPFTAGMQHQFINALRYCVSVPQAASLLAISWDDVQRDKQLVGAQATGRRAPGAVPNVAAGMAAGAPAQSFEAPPAPVAKAVDDSGVPAATHPNWQRLLDTDLPIEIRTLGLQMLLARIRTASSESMTEAQRLIRIKEVREYCVKYQRFVQNELDQLFA